MVMLGSGDPGPEHGLRVMEQNHRGRAVGWVGFSVPTSHRITAAADILQHAEPVRAVRTEPAVRARAYGARAPWRTRREG